MNNMMNYKGYYGTVEFSDTDNILFGKVVGIRGLISYEGNSVQSLKEDFEGAVDEYIEMCSRNGEQPETPFNIYIGSDLAVDN